MSVLASLVQVVAAAVLTLTPGQCSHSGTTNSTSKGGVGTELLPHHGDTGGCSAGVSWEVEHMYSPSCVPLVRCAGCCGDENLECHPTLTSNVTMQLLKLKPTEQGQEYVEMMFVEHKSCECRLRKHTPKHDRSKPRGRGRKRKEKQRVKDCDRCQPPRR